MSLILQGKLIDPLEKVFFSHKMLTIKEHKCFKDIKVSYGKKTHHPTCWMN